MSSEIKKLRENLDKIAKDHQQFGLSDVYVPIKRKEETMSYGSEDCIIGREADKEAVVDMLLGDPENLNRCSYVTIVGIGGLGKTALAQLVYNDSRIIEEKFDKMFWVCVSEDFGMEQIFRKMVGKDGFNHNIEELQNQVRKLIQGKRYFLVLDDVWCESRDEWDKVKAFLGLGKRGSKILITTHLKMVASVAGDELMHELKGLSEENSWKLFRRMAFKQEKESITVDADVDDGLTKIGKEIVKKCANVPLCIRVVGSMLYEQNESKWVSFQKLDLIKMGKGEDGIMPILKFSYHHLTPVLKSCFSYCALYPKDYLITKDELIKLWLALGCLESDDFRSPEEMGEECFSILLNKCFLQDITKDDYDKIISCKMHDLIHDLAQYVAGKECEMLDNSNACQIYTKTRHVSFISVQPHNLSGLILEMKAVRTVFQVDYYSWFRTEAFELDVVSMISGLRYARMLDLRYFKLKSFPDTISRRSHLRSLYLSGNSHLNILPVSIVKLHNLQILDLSDTGLTQLPRDTMKLVNLRHLNLTGCDDLTHMPVGMSTMTSLRTLTKFIVGDETCNQKIGRLRDLEALVNLKGELEIIFKSNYSCNLADLDGAELLRKVHLKKLTVSWEGLDEGDFSKSDHESLLRVLQPQRNLKSLSIGGYQGLNLPAWVESVSTSLPYLSKIILEQCTKLEHVPSMSELRHLKTVSLECLEIVEFISKGRCDDLIFFPSLEWLELRNLLKCTGWCGNGFVSSISSFPRLHNLIINGCPNLISIPACPNLKTLNLRSFNEALKCMGSDRGAPNLGTCAYLKEVSIDNVRAVNGLIGESLSSIQKLNIEECMEERFLIESEGFLIRCAASLRELDIFDCHELKSLSGPGLGHCTNLQSLGLWTCPNLDLDDEEEMTMWASLQSLSSLRLYYLPQMVNLPKGLQNMTRLQSLDISFCENMEALPDWLSCLTSLTSLDLFGCKKLVDRCREPNGQDWPKISHISHINVSLC